MDVRIKKITFESQSCWGTIDEAYKDKLTIKNGEVSYVYKPEIESEINPYRKWSYKTNSPIVTMLYESLTKNYEAVKALPDEWCTDILPTVVKFYFEDGHVDLVETYDLSAAEDFLICVRRLVPETEYMPVCIATSEDYEEDDENDDQS